MTDTPRPTVIEDLERFRTPAEPRLSPDAARVAFTVRAVDRDKNRSVSRVWVVPVDGSAPARPWTAPVESASNPRWAPDGSALAFVSSREEKKAQLFALPGDGGEAERLTDLPAGALADYAFSPDSARIAFLFRPTDESQRDEAVEARKKKNLSTPPREIVRLRWRTEGVGFLPEAGFGIRILARASRQCETLELGEPGRDIGGFCWAPDGARIAFTRNVAPDPDRRPGDTGLFVVELASGDVRRLTDAPGPKGALAFSPDGARIAYLGHDDPNDTWGVRNAHVWVVESDGAARDLTPDWDVTAGDLSLGEVSGRGDNGPIWNKAGDAVFVVASDHGRVDIWKIGLDGARERVVRDAVGIATDGETIVHLGVAPTDAGDLYVGVRRLTQVNEELLAEIALQTPVTFTAEAPDRQAVPCFALLPPDYGSDPRPRPTLLYIHGGPHLMYGERHLFHEYQALAAAGYVVLFPNPRGSRGYGEAWTGAIRGDWGAPAMADVMACVDEAITRGWSDPERLGVLGGSYGGYLTAWIVGHTDRFKAAIAERGVFDLVSMAGTSDFPWRNFDYFPGNTTDKTEALRRLSPQAYAEQVATPLLIVHSEGDLRCPIGQAEQYFRAVALTERCEVRFLRYGPEANHELSRGGPPDLRLDRQRRIHAWFDRFLKEKEQ